MIRLVMLFTVLIVSVPSSAQLTDVAVWQLVLGGTGHEEAYGMINTLDGGLLIVGYTTSSNNGNIEGSNRGGQDFWIVKLDNASPPNIQWEKNYGGYKDDVAFKAIQDNESGHYTVIGKTNSGRSGDITYDSIGGFDYWMIELDMNGTIVRDTLFGTSKLDGYNNKKLDDFTQIELLQSRDQKHIVFLGDVGKTSVNPADIDLWWIKMNRKNWFDSSSIEKKFNQYEPENQYTGTLVSGLLELSDYSYLLISNAGDFYNRDQYWLLKIDSNGIYQTDRMVGGTKDDYPRDAILDDRGDIVVIGQSNSSDIDHQSGVYWARAGYPSTDFWVVKFDSSNLKIIWEKNYGGMEREDIGRKIVQAEDGGYYLSGRFWGEKHTGDVCGHHSALIKIDRDGEIEWSTAVGNSGSTFGFYNLVLQNGLPVASGYSDGGGDIDPSQFHGGIDVWVVKFEEKDCDPLEKPMLTQTLMGDSTLLGISNPHNHPQILFRWSSALKDTSIENAFLKVSNSDLSLYVVRFNLNCCFSPASDTIGITDKPPFKLPEHPVITPNGDGINDTWDIEGLPNGSTLSIYNRWGACVWVSSDDEPDWNGVSQDKKPLPEGYYRFKLVVPGQGKAYIGYIKILF